LSPGKKRKKERGKKVMNIGLSWGVPYPNAKGMNSVAKRSGKENKGYGLVKEQITQKRLWEQKRQHFGWQDLRKK